MISQRLVVLVADVGRECSDSLSLEELSLEFLYSLSLGELSSGFSDSSSLGDLPLIDLEDYCSVRRLGNSLSELDRDGFGPVLAFFVADGVTLLFFEVDDSCCLLLEDVLAISCLLFLTLNLLSERMVVDSWYLSGLESTFGTLSRWSDCMPKFPRKYTSFPTLLVALTSIFSSTILVKAPSTLWLGDLYPRKTLSSVREKKHGMSKKTRRMASVWGPMLRLLLVDFHSENL
jgi:hypothetical protein